LRATTKLRKLNIKKTPPPVNRRRGLLFPAACLLRERGSITSLKALYSLGFGEDNGKWPAISPRPVKNFCFSLDIFDIKLM
jgi:hypothetical protein